MFDNVGLVLLWVLYILAIVISNYRYLKLKILGPRSLTFVLLNPDIPCLCSVDPDQLASEEANWSSEANWSGSALFVIKYVNL